MKPSQTKPPQKSPAPHSDWTPGSKIAAPFSGMTEFDPKKLTQQEVYRLMIGTIVPRPIALVSTVSVNGVANLAPFSFFNGVSSNPACIMLGIGNRPDGSPKDTLRNIIDTGEFVVNSTNEWLVQPAVYSAAAFAPEEDEISITGLTPLPSQKIRPTRIAESAAQFECKLLQTIPLSAANSRGGTTLVLGTIELMHVATEMLESSGSVSFEKFQAVARLGGVSYGRIGELYDIPVESLTPRPAKQ